VYTEANGVPDRPQNNKEIKMINKTLYLRNHDAATKPVTLLTEQKQQQLLKRRLGRQLEKAVLTYLEQTAGFEAQPHTYSLKFTYDIKPTGSILVQKIFSPAGFGDFGTHNDPAQIVEEHRVPKSKLFFA
jgi:hypothetical protein